MLTHHQASEHVARADKTAPLPGPEKGGAIEGLGASGGGDKNAAPVNNSK